MNRSLTTQQSLYTVSEQATRQLGRWQVAALTGEVSAARPVFFAKQIHGGNIVEAQYSVAEEIKADGVLVKKDGKAGGVKTADCAPVVIVSDNIALVLHVSRKTIVRGLLENVTTYIRPEEMNHIYIGSHICEYHFNFVEEDELLRQFRYRFPEAVHFHKGKLYLSLKKALESIFSDWRVHPDKIVADARCTYEQITVPSYRRWLEEGKKGELPLLKTVVWREV